MNKYNEIMNNVSVDPAMKNRIMSAVSAAIKEQSARPGNAGPVKNPEIRKIPEPARVSDIPQDEPKAPVRKKAKKTPVVVISSIAAGILVIAGVLFVFSKLSSSGIKTAEYAYSTTVAEFIHNAAAPQAEGEYYAEETEAYEDKTEEIAAPGLQGDTVDNSSRDNSVGSDNKNTLTANVTYEPVGSSDFEQDESEGMGDARLNTISRTLPFEIKGTGSGQFSENISEEVFFGNNGEKMIVFTAPEGTDIVNEVFREIYDIFHQKQYEGVEAATPEGTPITLYRVPFGNVTGLAEGETLTDVNAAAFNKNGNTYLIVFSDFQPVEVIGGVIDVL